MEILKDKNNYEYEILPFEKFQEKYKNQKFNSLTAIAPIKITNHSYKEQAKTNAWWLFQCDCGNLFCHRMASVRAGETQDCGCVKEKNDKYIGQTYNYLTIIEKDLQYKKQNNIKSPNSYYKCQCKCGNFKTVRITAITSGEVKSCGCLKKEQEQFNLIHGYNFQDLTGKKFGYLTVLKKGKTDKKGNIFWTCQCECGTIKDIRGISLRNGDTISCGCSVISHGEYKIKQILEQAQIDFLFNSTFFKDLILPTGGIGRYDFILFKENKPYRLIEFDGKQHYQSVDYFGGEEKFLALQKNDLVKNQYAQSHNLPLVRIPYTEINNINLNLLLGNDYLI